MENTNNSPISSISRELKDNRKNMNSTAKGFTLLICKPQQHLMSSQPHKRGFSTTPCLQTDLCNAWACEGPDRQNLGPQKAAWSWSNSTMVYVVNLMRGPWGTSAVKPSTFSVGLHLHRRRLGHSRNRKSVAFTEQRRTVDRNHSQKTDFWMDSPRREGRFNCGREKVMATKCWMKWRKK